MHPVKIVVTLFVTALLAACAPQATSEQNLETPIASATSPALIANLPPEGYAGFRDKFAIGDAFVVNLAQMEAAPEGQVYQSWLVADDGRALSLGLLAVHPDGSASLEWISPNGENLLARFSGFQITLEPAGGSPAPSGGVKLTGGLEPADLQAARRLFVYNDGEPAAPSGTALAPGLVIQTNLALQQVQNAVDAAASGSQDQVHVYLENVINLLEGRAGPRTLDYSGDGIAQNPGDELGLKGYAQQISLLIGSTTASEVESSLVEQITQIQDQCAKIIALPDLAEAGAELAKLQELVVDLKNGPVVVFYQVAQRLLFFQVRFTE